MKETIRSNIFGGKITSSLGALVAIFSLLGLQGDPSTTEAVHRFLTANADTIAQVVAVVALLFARDPEVLTEPKNNEAVVEERVKKEVDRILNLVRAENPRAGTTENPT